MLTYNELIELREKLINNEISIEQAKELYGNDLKEGKRSWHTKDWKNRKAEIIKDKCEICSSTEVLTLQHLSHPKKFADYLLEVKRTYAKNQINSNPEIEISVFRKYALEKYDYLPIPLCPNCRNKNPSERVRKMPKYRCTDCKCEFDEPVYIEVNELISLFYKNVDAIEVQDKCFVSKKWRNQHNLSSVKYWFLRENATEINAEKIEKEAFLLYLNDNIKYLSFEDTITTCKKCASSYDLFNMELCPKCKTNYKSIEFKTCFDCLPEEQQKFVLASREFAKQMRDINKRLDID
ncbi:hypothetical protein [Flavobacterium sp.]|uniref:hypothetical protein n=1 Tax=Flavobacterium sp. TaxID=239 RepID=UPI004048A1FD